MEDTFPIIRIKTDLEQEFGVSFTEFHGTSLYISYCLKKLLISGLEGHFVIPFKGLDIRLRDNYIIFWNRETSIGICLECEDGAEADKIFFKAFSNPTYVTCGVIPDEEPFFEILFTQCILKLKTET